MRELAAYLVIAQGGECSGAGLTGGFATAEGIGGGRRYCVRAKTYASKQVSDSARQPGNGIHRVHDHICGGAHWTHRARDQRFCEYIAVTHAIELSDRRNFGETYLQHIEAFDVVGTCVVMNHARVGDDG